MVDIMSRTYLLRVQIPLLIARHVLRQTHSLEPQLDSAPDDVFELVNRVAGAELARVGMHGEGHGRRSGGTGRETKKHWATPCCTIHVPGLDVDKSWSRNPFFFFPRAAPPCSNARRGRGEAGVFPGNVLASVSRRGAGRVYGGNRE